MDTAEVKMDPCGYDGCDKMSVPGTDRCFIHDLRYPGEPIPKVIFGQTLIIHGDDWQVRIFSSASQPRYPERTYFVLHEDAYGEQILQMQTEAEIDARLGAAVKNGGLVSPRSLEEALRLANIDRSMNEYNFPATPPVETKDI